MSYIFEALQRAEAERSVEILPKKRTRSLSCCTGLNRKSNVGRPCPNCPPRKSAGVESVPVEAPPSDLRSDLRTELRSAQLRPVEARPVEIPPVELRTAELSRDEVPQAELRPVEFSQAPTPSIEMPTAVEQASSEGANSSR